MSIPSSHPVVAHKPVNDTNSADNASPPLPGNSPRRQMIEDICNADPNAEKFKRALAPRADNSYRAYAISIKRSDLRLFNPTVPREPNRGNEEAPVFARELYPLEEVEETKAAASPKIIDQLETLVFRDDRGKRFETKLANLNFRVVVAAKIGEVRVPFYLCSGREPKEGVTPGKWYPFFGVTDEGWFVKNKDLKNYYNSDKLRQVAEQLDRELGDIRADSRAPAFSSMPVMLQDFLNKDMKSVAYERQAAASIAPMVQLIEAGGTPDPDGCRIL